MIENSPEGLCIAQAINLIVIVGCRPNAARVPALQSQAQQRGGGAAHDQVANARVAVGPIITSSAAPWVLSRAGSTCLGSPGISVVSTVKPAAQQALGVLQLLVCLRGVGPNHRHQGRQTP